MGPEGPVFQREALPPQCAGEGSLGLQQRFRRLRGQMEDPAREEAQNGAGQGHVGHACEMPAEKLPQHRHPVRSDLPQKGQGQVEVFPAGDPAGAERKIERPCPDSYRHGRLMAFRPRHHKELTF